MPRRFLWLALFVLGCSSDPARPVAGSSGSAGPSGGGGGAGQTSDGGVREGGTDGGSCTDLALTGFVVDLTGTVGDPPDGQGGDIAAGTYDLQDARRYVGAGNPAPTETTFQESMRVTGTMIERVATITTPTGTRRVNERGTFTAGGMNLTYVTSCPGSGQRSYAFTALSGSLTLSDLVTKESFVYVKK
jgi:hypothetical protein